MMMHYLLTRLADCNLHPNKGEFQFFATTEVAAEKAPSWLSCPYHITDDNLRANIENLENKAARARAEAKHAPPDKQAAAMEAVEAATEAVKAARIILDFPLT